MAAPSDEQLRESARHRGLKLVKSRRRKPGGDFGLYGLATLDGTPVFGMGDNGLTATAEEVADFLRKGDAATWASSVEATPERPARDPAPQLSDTTQSDAEEAEPAPPPMPPRQPPRRPPRARPVRAKATASPPPAPPPPAPVLAIRAATRADAAAVAALTPGVDRAIIAERIAAAAALGEPVYVADQDGIVGCLAWHVIPTLQHGPVARMTFLFVAAAHRRRGIGQRLVDQLMEVAATQDLPLVEAVSDIALENSHGFFRRLGFDQTSYRFTRAPAPDA